MCSLLKIICFLLFLFVGIQIKCQSMYFVIINSLYIYCDVHLHVLAHSNWGFIKLVVKFLFLYVQKSDLLMQSLL